MINKIVKYECIRSRMRECKYYEEIKMKNGHKSCKHIDCFGRCVNRQHIEDYENEKIYPPLVKKTNFEKWKEGLTVDWFVEMFEGIDDDLSCDHCPVECVLPLSYEGECTKNFTQWANAEVGNEN